ncbi:translocation/assembly module TamB domain-containing protein [Rhizobium sp. L1K21]|uniref:translocation/assembly module TamB domain-containing protein n=1 Tax=Rhizobium sp. L1K21 TaxID=2954933 RepID=UPI0020939F9D|nr:translocation/assembly module TamB domain-containing protein [Rhizobium sp. L1K21]MCO6188085.1 translocation/assembly module TamB domain-containing protein [Rhizobium sp. L1K21]
MKYIKTLFVILGLLLLLFVGGIAFAGFTQTGTRLALNIALPLINSDNLKISIDEPSALLSGDLTAKHIAIADAEDTWLEIDNLKADWSPVDLLSATLKVNALSADAVNLDRLPESDSTGDTSSGGLPVALDINGISLPQVILGETFSGKTEKLALNGNLALDQDRIATDLKATDLNRGDAEVVAKVDYDVAANNLALDLNVNEANGGFVSSLLKLPGDPALAINVEGKGPLNNWKGEAHGALEGVEVVRFDANYRQPESGKNIIAVSGGGALDALMPPAVSPLFAGTTKVDVEAEIGTEGSVSVNRGLVQTGALSAKVSGRYTPEGQNDLQAQITALNDVADFNFLTDDGGWRVLLKSADIAISGPAEASNITVNAALDKVEVQAGEIDGVNLSIRSGAFDLKNRAGAISATLRVDSSRFDDENLDRLVEAPLTLGLPLTVDGDQVSVEGAELQSASIGGTFDAQYDLAESTGSADFKLFAAPSVLPPDLAANVTKATGLEGRATFSADGNFALPTLTIDSELLSAQGSASLDDGAISADLTGKIPDLSLWRSDLSGEAELAAKASGTLAQPSASFEFSVAEAMVSGQELQDLSASLSGQVNEVGPAASLRVEGVLGGQTVQAEADLQTLENGGYSIPNIKAEAGANQLQGSLTLTKALEPNGRFSFDLPEIGLLGAIAGQEMAGDLKGTAEISQTDGELAAKIDATGSRLSIASAEIVEPVVHVTTQGPLISGRVETASISASGNRIDNPVLTFDRDGNAVAFDFAARYDNADAKANGTITTGDATTVALETLNVKPRGIPISLKEPASIVVANGGARIESASLSVGGGSLDISGSVGDDLAITAKLSSIPASLANTFAQDLGAAGSISGTVKVTGTPSDPDVAYDLRLDGSSVAQMRSLGIGSISASANGRFQRNNLSLDLAAKNAAGLSLNGGGSINLSSNTLDLRFSGPLSTSLLNGATAGQGISFTGTANADVTVSGSFASPQINGRVTLDNVGADLVRQNISVQGVTGEVQLQGDTATLSDVKGNFSNGGSFTASGTVGTSGDFPADLTINLNGVQYTDGNLVSATLGGEVKITGGLTGTPTIAGTINVAQANITVPETLPTSIAAINLEHKNAPADVARQYAEIKPANTGDGNQAAANLDLTVKAPNQIFVRGRGMDAELGGTVGINGTTSNPIVSGGFEMIRGRLSLLGKRLDFTSGKIGFSGGLIPNLALNATTKAGSTTVTIGVDGPANDPQFTFSSSPSLPEDEVLAQLVFQQSTSKLSPFQIAQLADAVAQLTGARTGSVFSKLRQAGGLDNLDVTSDDAGNAEVTAGKYLNSKTYLELQQNTGTGSGKAIINLDVGRGVTLRGEADSDGAGAAGIFYEKEY